MNISDRVKSIRESKRFTQAAIAEALGMDRANYNKLERRGSKMSIEQLQSIASALEVPVVELMGVEEKREGTEQASKIEELEKEIKDLKRINEVYEALYNEYVSKLHSLHSGLVHSVQEDIINTALVKGILTEDRYKGWLVSVDQWDDDKYHFWLDIDSIEGKDLDPDDFILSNFMTESEIQRCMDVNDDSMMQELILLYGNMLIKDKGVERAFLKQQRKKYFPERFQKE